MLIVTAAGVRYPLETLMRRANVGDLAVLARRLGLKHGTVRDAACVGLTDRQADRWSCRLGLHPSWVWGEQWWRNGPSELDRTG